MGGYTKFQLCARLDRVEAELDEARAQIADQNDALVEAANLRTDLRAQIVAKDAEIARLTQRNWATTIREQEELAEARARIAAKDAALQRLTDGLQTIATSFYKGDQYQDYAKHVLAGPARGTE